MSPPGPIAAVFLTGVALVAGAALAGCFTSKACTEQGCQDQFHATVASADGSIPSGTHLLEVTADSMTVSCTFQVPLAKQPMGGNVAPQCPQGLRVFIGQASTCTETDTTSSKSLSCVPIAGHFFEDITVSGKPAQLRVRLTVDGAVVLDSTETPVYHSNQPNGPGCDPTCHQASAQWMFTPSTVGVVVDGGADVGVDARSSDSADGVTVEGGDGAGSDGLPPHHGCLPVVEGSTECGAGNWSCTLEHVCCNGVGSDCIHFDLPDSGVDASLAPCTTDEMCPETEYCQEAKQCCPIKYHCNLN